EHKQSEHLGNVLSTVTDRKLPIDLSANQQVDYFNADIAGANDYYPFGMLQVNRGYSLAEYRFGFNGMESDNEIKGNGNSLDFGARIYDARLGKWLAVDPYNGKYPDLSPYHFGYNNPIITIDPNGKENVIVIGSPENRNWYSFKNAGKVEATRILDHFTENNEATTVLINTTYFSSSQLSIVKAELVENGINENNILFVSSKNEIIDYVNNKSYEGNQSKGSRANDLITDFSYVGHAWEGELLYESLITEGLLPSDFDKNAFDQNSSRAFLIGCTTAGDDYPNLLGETSNITEYFAKNIVSDYALGSQDGTWMGEKVKGGIPFEPGYQFQDRGAKAYFSQPLEKAEVKNINVQLNSKPKLSEAQKVSQ
ncbi:MAG: RHS repeat-associated core domain-containing protein, partial [Bacteroidota bacterium]|nr:RHS repeat-associated core domain-containing protein [Bacteroidota bacterium]